MVENEKNLSLMPAVRNLSLNADIKAISKSIIIRWGVKSKNKDFNAFRTSIYLWNDLSLKYKQEENFVYFLYHV